MAPYFPVYVRRSDGKSAVAKTPSVKEPNEPLPEQLDKTPNAQGICDYYRQCNFGETKEVDWRRKLAGMLLREIGGTEYKEKSFILAAFPENYRLYEHVRCKISEVDGKVEKATKTHAAGGNERQDAYLYGYPQGRKKRFRSPAEFFPHLLWLCTDEKGDSNNCSCKFCSPEELETDEKPKLQAKDSKSQQVAKQEPPSSKPRPASSKQDGQREPSQQISQQSSHEPKFSPLPRLRRNEQKVDLYFNKFLYRPGELIWFQRGSAWGLGVIAQRDASSDNPQEYQYRVQPLSHPLAHPQQLICAQHQLRAWLCWSPPLCMSDDLKPSPSNNYRVYSYDTVDWQAYLNGRYGRGDAEVDGSILAAKAVETTYSLFDLLESKTSTKESTQTSEIYYNGMFLGAEKIWLGDPLRIRNSANMTDMMVLQAIIERQSPTDHSRSQVALVGDVYSQQVSKSKPSTGTKDSEYLPLRVRGDLEARMKITSRATDTANRVNHYWQLETKGAQLSIAEIKGRWYESSLLMPILAREAYEAGLGKGELSDAGMWMNGHGDCNRSPEAGPSAFRPAEFKVKKREDAFIQAVPASFKIIQGLNDSKGGEMPSGQANVQIKMERPAHARQSMPTQQQLLQNQHSPHNTQSAASGQHTQQVQAYANTQNHQLQHQQQQQLTQEPANPLHQQQNQQYHQYQRQQGQHDHFSTTDGSGDQIMEEAPLDSASGAFEQYMDFSHANGHPGHFGEYSAEQHYDNRGFEDAFFKDNDGMS